MKVIVSGVDIHGRMLTKQPIKAVAIQLEQHNGKGPVLVIYHEGRIQTHLEPHNIHHLEIMENQKEMNQ